MGEVVAARRRSFAQLWQRVFGVSTSGMSILQLTFLGTPRNTTELALPERSTPPPVWALQR